MESKELTYIVTALPLHGTLYANGVELTSPGEVIPAPYEMKYDPPLNVHGMPFDTLGFAVTDGEMQSEIQTMDVSIDGNSALDLNRMNGAAVKFIAFKPADLSGDFTVSAWVKLAMAAKTHAERALPHLTSVVNRALLRRIRRLLFFPDERSLASHWFHSVSVSRWSLEYR